MTRSKYRYPKTIRTVVGAVVCCLCMVYMDSVNSGSRRTDSFASVCHFPIPPVSTSLISLVVSRTPAKCRNSK
ncbi:hypothetical protein QBC34DRAFT_7836 [Podospora aff. communis PSN243]|uniref:Secreted protein n=1 Tax=Podospora aff. communis PSN243 TaxID=3040156 RepID=A0AAV9H4P9_9PEZI|nr:hypothetical protein QBC34DRAFT_7836 [Podospora aff. communis PSN243]